MLNASVDTDVIIHLYSSGKKGLLFTFFDKLFMHEYLFENELKYISKSVYEKLKVDLDKGLLEIITNKRLIEMGIKGLFEEYKRDYEYLFDQGELYAVSLAKAMGIAAFVSDDTKRHGPHETLVNELIEDVIPFAFYEILFHKFLLSEISLSEMQQEFEHVTSKSMRQYPMNFKKRMLKTVRRFSQKYGSKRDYDWICDFCDQKKLIIKVKCKNFVSIFLRLNRIIKY